MDIEELANELQDTFSTGSLSGDELREFGRAHCHPNWNCEFCSWLAEGGESIVSIFIGRGNAASWLPDVSDCPDDLVVDFCNSLLEIYSADEPPPSDLSDLTLHPACTAGIYDAWLTQFVLATHRDAEDWVKVFPDELIARAALPGVTDDFLDRAITAIHEHFFSTCPNGPVQDCPNCIDLRGRALRAN